MKSIVLALSMICAAVAPASILAPAAPPAIVQTTPPTTGKGLGTGSEQDSLTTSVPDPDDKEIRHEVKTHRLPKEDDFEFFRRHANRVAEFKKFLRGGR